MKRLMYSVFLLCYNEYEVIVVRKIAIIGAGASGIMCAIHAVSQDTEVVLFDKNPVMGKKLLATGNGRCNYWNSDQNLTHYHSSHPELLANIITPKIQEEVLEFFDSLGVVPHIREGYYYPYSNQASSIRNLLESYAKKVGVIFALEEEVLGVSRQEEKFSVVLKDGVEYFDDLVIATGSKASPQTGSTGDGYFFAKKFGHHLVPICPALVQVVTEGDFLKNWAGVRAFCEVSLYQEEKFLKKEFGEIQLTDYGVSGICVFNLSRYIARGLLGKDTFCLTLNFLPFLSEKEEKEKRDWFFSRAQQLGEASLIDFFSGVLPYKLLFVILKRCGLSSSDSWNQLSDDEKKCLMNMILSFPLAVKDTKGFSSSQVCSGGVLLSEVSSSLESKFVKHLYFIGEVLDVDGDCGGYNLGFSFMSGMMVGKVLRGEGK